MWFICVEVEQETSAPPPKKNPGSAPERTPIFFAQFTLFWFILSCFLQFLSLLFFLKNKKLPQELYVRVFCPMMDIKLFFITGI